MVDEIMLEYGITNYDYDLSDKTLIIYQNIEVNTFVKIRNELYGVDNIIVKPHKHAKINV